MSTDTHLPPYQRGVWYTYTPVGVTMRVRGATHHWLLSIKCTK